MANWTSYQDVLDTWVGNNKPEDIELVNALINKAETFVLATYPLIQNRIDEGKISENVVIYVVTNMVERVLRNPDNRNTFSYTTGPYSESASYNGTNKGIWLTTEEKDLLAPNMKGKAYQVDLLAGSNAEYNTYGKRYVGDNEVEKEWIIRYSKDNLNDIDNTEEY